MSSQSPPQLPALRGGLIALLAAVLFGASTPLVQRFGAGIGSFSTAALLYAGAAAVGALLRRPVESEARVRAGDARRRALMARFGAVIGPVALAWGLQGTSGASASLMLTLEAVFTAVLARLWYHESLDRRVVLAMTLLTLGGMALVLGRAESGATPMLGLLAVVLATAAWGVDNTLSRAVAERDPGQVVMLKGALGALATTLLAFLFGEPLPALWPALLPAGPTLIRRRANRLGVCVRSLRGGRNRLCTRRARRQRLDAGRWNADGGRHRAALGGASRAQSRARADGA
jgi:drug/metabolite transporter (DMT)-like permease